MLWYPSWRPETDESLLIRKLLGSLDCLMQGAPSQSSSSTEAWQRNELVRINTPMLLTFRTFEQFFFPMAAQVGSQTPNMFLLNEYFSIQTDTCSNDSFFQVGKDKVRKRALALDNAEPNSTGTGETVTKSNG